LSGEAVRTRSPAARPRRDPHHRDHGEDGLTAAAVAAHVSIGGEYARVVTGEELERPSDPELDALLRHGQELIFARSTPEAKLRIADALRA
jgi:magnesium-transporting ATPase (P-type)